MKRRNFITSAATAALGMGLGGCAMKPRNIKIEAAGVPFSFGENYPKPKGGSMPMGELGKTGIKVSKFTFGSHMRPYLRPYEREREQMIRDAHDLGVNTYDIYDKEHEVYQYEPMGRFLKPIINDVNVSIALLPYDGRDVTQQFERDLRVLGRDHIDMVRIHAHKKTDDRWKYWDQLFKWKEEGKIRAVGVPIHYYDDLFPVIDEYPIDYVVFPFNFYMNVCWDSYKMNAPEKYATIPQLLKDRGIGSVTMKPFAGDFLVSPLIDVADEFKREKEIRFAQSMLRYVIDTGVADTTFTGMYYPSHVYENVDAYYNPEMSSEEKRLLDKVRRVARTKAYSLLPEHYKFFSKWVPEHAQENGMRTV